MLSENINRNAVLQSITDTWLPLIGMVAAIILVAIILIKMFFQLFCFTAGPQQKSARLLQGSVRALSCLFLCF